MTLKELEIKQAGIAQCIMDAWQLKVPLHIIRMYEREAERIKVAIETITQQRLYDANAQSANADCV